jgi:2-oxoglutarate ferredoxin oxidoreductase subunit alpha
MKSFQLAERYQTPVIVLTDFFVGNRVENVATPHPSDEDKADWSIRPAEETKGQYRRYEVTESGISPRAVPGMEGFIFHATGLEHSEKGLPDYTPQNHIKMTEKRHAKIRGALADLPEPEELSAGGRMDVGVIAWGSTFGSALEAVQKARAEGLAVGALKIVSIYPYHAETIREFMDRCEELLIPELNFEGQLANLVGHLHRKDVIRLNVVTGVPFSVTRILEKIKELAEAVNAKYEEEKRL